MLTKRDIAFIKETRTEILANRTRTVEIEYQTKGKRNPITGNYETTTGRRAITAVVTDITSKVVEERRIKDMALAIEGDILLSVNIEEFDGIPPSDIRYIYHNGDKYSLAAEDPKGIGEYTRYELLAKKVV